MHPGKMRSGTLEAGAKKPGKPENELQMPGNPTILTSNMRLSVSINVHQWLNPHLPKMRSTEPPPSVRLPKLLFDQRKSEAFIRIVQSMREVGFTGGDVSDHDISQLLTGKELCNYESIDNPVTQ